MNYVGLIRDLQRWYAPKDGDAGTALYTAILLLSALATINVFSVCGTLEEMIYGHLLPISLNKGFQLIVFVCVVLLHAATVKIAVPNERLRIPTGTRFPHGAKIYIAITALVFLLFIAVTTYNSVMRD